MATERPDRNYPGSMAVLYATARVIWQSYLLNVLLFTDFLSTYVAQVGTDALAAIDAAEALPEFQARNEASELLAQELSVRAEECLMNWRYLERYIIRLMPESEHETRIEAAGKDH